jgi:hypothetical protein
MNEINLAINAVFPEILARGHMYLDPGSGSFLLQILIATIAGAGIFIVTYWRKVKAFLKRLFGKKQDPSDSVKSKDD